MPLTRNQLSRFNWRRVFAGPGCTVFGCGDPDVHIMHTWQEGENGKRNGKVRITYIVRGRRTDSPSEAVRLYNQEELDGRRGRPCAPGSPRQIAARSAALCGRGDVRA